MSNKPLLAICAIAKNEGRYIYEWLSFHHAAGVDRFFIYDNGSTDNTLDEIRRWPMADMVTVIPWPHVPGQLAAYMHMINTFRDAAEWCAFIDCDEFLRPTGTLPIPEFLLNISPLCNGIYVHWLMFGSSGKTHYENSPITQRFLRRSREDFEPNNIGKSLIRLSSAKLPGNPHVILCEGRMINDSNVELDQQGSGIYPSSSHRYIALNHYFTKSLEEWEWRRSLGKADKSSNDPDFRRSYREFELHDANDVLDTRAAEIMETAKQKFY